jgi:hypothetical protein
MTQQRDAVSESRVYIYLPAEHCYGIISLPSSSG